MNYSRNLLGPISAKIRKFTMAASKSAEESMLNSVEKTSDDKVALQKVTTELRLEFLDILSKLEGKKASFNLYKKQNPSSGVFRGSDRDILHFAVSDFESPTGVMNSATIRTTDIDCMTIPVNLDDGNRMVFSSDGSVAK